MVCRFAWNYNTVQRLSKYSVVLDHEVETLGLYITLEMMILPLHIARLLFLSSFSQLVLWVSFWASISMKNFHRMKTAWPSYIIVTYTSKRKLIIQWIEGTCYHQRLKIALVHALRASAILLSLKNFLELNTKLHSKSSYYLIS